MIKCIDRMDVEFIVQEEKGIVVARIEEPIDLFLDLYNTDICQNAAYAIFDESLAFKLAELRGIAKCSDEDVFDVAIGKRIALNKLKVKIVKLLKSRINMYMKTLNKEINASKVKMMELSLHKLTLNDRILKTYDKIQSK